MAAVMSATLSSRRRSEIASTSMPSMPSVPLIKARPSFSARVTGEMPAASNASLVGIRVPARSRTSPLTHQRQCAMGKRSQIAGAAEAAVLVHDRRQAGVEHGDIAAQGRVTDSGTAGGESRNSQQHEGPHHLPLDLWSGSGGVRADQAALQLGAQLDRDVAGCQGAEAGGYPVMRFLIIRQRFDDLPGFANLCPSIIGNDDLGAVSCHCFQVFQGDRADSDRDAPLISK